MLKSRGAVPTQRKWSKGGGMGSRAGTPIIGGEFGDEGGIEIPKRKSSLMRREVSLSKGFL